MLLFPLKNSECNVGTDSTATESDVIFEWDIAENTDIYELNLKNLSTGQQIKETTESLSLSLRIERSTPFEWYIVSKSNTRSDTAVSEVWRFYNAGEAIINHPPFPAQILAPAMAEIISNTNNTISLSWNAIDLDDDIIGFDVYFGTGNPPPLIESNITDNTVTNLSVSANTVYYWKVVTKDAYGNSSDSGVYQFRVD